MRLNQIIFLLFCFINLTACQSITEKATGGDETQLQTREIQTRKYDNLTKEQALRASIATLQDLNFTINKTDYLLGSITGTKLSHGIIKISVIVRSKNNGTIIRANARQGKHPISQLDVYQNFFSVLDKSIFLLKNDVN